MENKFKIKYRVGDLVCIINDCYVFMEDRAKVLKMGGIGIIVQVDYPKGTECAEDIWSFWEEAVKVEIEGGSIGWIQVSNLILVSDDA